MQGLSQAKTNSQSSESSDETIQRVLSGYELGRKLRQLRMKKKLGLVDLGRHTGLSASMLSQLENGKLIPTLPTLARIAMVFDASLDFFFSGNPRQSSFHLVRALERLRFPEKPELRSPGYFFESRAFPANNKGLQGYWAIFPPHDKEFSLPHTHEGHELIYLIEGNLTVRHDGEDFEMGPGDSAYFDASEIHSYRGNMPDGAKAVIATTSGKT